jgi:hypothetical protein
MNSHVVWITARRGGLHSRLLVSGWYAIFTISDIIWMDKGLIVFNDRIEINAGYVENNNVLQ